jgi:hypothetical protein
MIVSWYVVGRALDRRRTSKVVEGRHVVASLIVYLLLLTLGGLLFFDGMHDIKQRYNLDPPVVVFLTLIWSITLIFLSGRGIVRVVRPAFRH